MANITHQMLAHSGAVNGTLHALHISDLLRYKQLETAHNKNVSSQKTRVIKPFYLNFTSQQPNRV